jgi:lysyl-tRNA synthetase class II
VGVDEYNKVFKKLVDIGDFVGIKGFVFKTRTGETTVHAEEFTFLAKLSAPCPHPKKLKMKREKWLRTMHFPIKSCVTASAMWTWL